MKLQPCSACGAVGYSEGAHVLGNGGMSRKADADTQAPLCGRRWSEDGESFLLGCHTLYDEHRWMFDIDFPEYDPEKAARETEQKWQEHLGDKTEKNQRQVQVPAHLTQYRNV